MINMTRKKKKIIKAVIYSAVMFVIVLLWIMPFVWAFVTSFKSDADIDAHLLSFIPREFTFSRYSKLLFENSADYPVLKWLFNSVWIAASYTFLHLVVVSLAAYAFSILKFKGRNLLFTLILTTMMIPSVINLVPMFNMMVKFNWIGSPLSMIIPGIAGVYSMFLIRQFFLGIPDSLVESAHIEGAGHFTVFLRIVIPLSSSAFMVAGLFAFLANWNDYMWPQLMLASEELSKMTLTVGLSLMQGSYGYDLGLTMTAAIVSAIPVLLLFLFTQEKVVDGIATAGMKD